MVSPKRGQGPETLVLFRVGPNFYTNMKAAKHQEKDKDIVMFTVEFSKSGIARALREVASE